MKGHSSLCIPAKPSCGRISFIPTALEGRTRAEWKEGWFHLKVWIIFLIRRCFTAKEPVRCRFPGPIKVEAESSNQDCLNWLPQANLKGLQIKFHWTLQKWHKYFQRCSLKSPQFWFIVRCFSKTSRGGGVVFGTPLKSQHLEDWGGKISSSRPVWTIQLRPYLKNK